MPFESTLSSYVSDSPCYPSNSPGLVVAKDFNGALDIGHPREDDDQDDASNDRTDQDKFLILSRNFYQEVPGSVPAYGGFNAGKVFNPYQGRLSFSSSGTHFEEESPRTPKSPPFESPYMDYAEKLKDAVACEEQEQKLFMAEEESEVFVHKSIYPWMVHNTKNRQQQVQEGDKEQFNQYLGKILVFVPFLKTTYTIYKNITSKYYIYKLSLFKSIQSI